MFCNAILAASLLLRNELLDAFLFFFEFAKRHNIAVGLPLGLTVGGKRISSRGRERAAVEPSLLIISLTIRNPGRFLTPQKYVLLLDALAMSKLIYLVRGCRVLPDKPMALISIGHVLILTVDRN